MLKGGILEESVLFWFCSVLSQITVVIGNTLSLEQVLHLLRCCGPGQNLGGKAVLGRKGLIPFQKLTEELRSTEEISSSA